MQVMYHVYMISTDDVGHVDRNLDCLACLASTIRICVVYILMRSGVDQLTSKHEALTQCWIKAGPASGQHLVFAGCIKCNGM